MTTTVRRFVVPILGTKNFFAGLDPQHCVKTALIAVEGQFNDSEGAPFTFDANRLNTIADFTNKALQKGTTIPVCLDHKVDFGNAVGTVDGQAYTKVITEDDLPNKRAASELLGKLGL